MAAIGRVGDIGVGVCPCHTSPVAYTTIIVSGPPSVRANGASVAIVGSVGVSTCGHATVALSGSPDVRATAASVHRVGDVGVNCGAYVLVTGSPDVNANV